MKSRLRKTDGRVNTGQLFYWEKGQFDDPGRSSPSDDEPADRPHSKYAFSTYCRIIRWVLKNEPFNAMACRITSMKRFRSL